MKPYDQLTRLGRLRRLRQLAQVALGQYALTGAHLTFLQYVGNVIYRVDTSHPVSSTGQKGPYLENRYVLRILTIRDMETIASELVWLAALSREAGLPVPEPVPTLDGRLLTTVTTPGVPQGRVVSLMRWVDGKRLTTGLRPSHFWSWGQVMASLHKFSAGWQPPEGFKRFRWDWAGLLGGRDFIRPVEAYETMMPQQYREPFQVMSQKAREVMEALGQGPDAYGMIHADMYPENVLFRDGQAFPIDFEDCGYGYWMWDIAVALCTWPWTEDWYWKRDAFLEGYATEHTLPESQLKQLDLFMAIQYATMVLWATALIKNDPARQAEHTEWQSQNGNNLLRYFERW
jgi:Ser/Thr protein kinase RdoA (MazF antagonist)